MAQEDIYQKSLEYHEKPYPGKIAIKLTKPADTAYDLTLAYSPGVAQPCREIYKDVDAAYRYTSKGNSVAVISDGTAILGLGALGPLASKPVMEGKALLFKRFANIDAIDIEVKHEGIDDFVRTVANIADSFGGINLEDIKAPECFEIETKLKKICKIPVFHDDQHGTAIITTAGMLNACELQGKKLEDCKIVCVGAGAAGIACMDLLTQCGAKKENLYVCDRHGVITSKRYDLTGRKAEFINDSGATTLAEALKDADILVGVSGPNVVTEEEVMGMAPKAIIFACSNPEPEIHPEIVRRCRPDIIMATGRSDYPNQINNLLCFPYLFRGALDVRAKDINLDMIKAAVRAIREVAKDPNIPPEVLTASGESHLEFGPHYIIPKPMDPRLLKKIARAVAEAAVKSGVAQLPLPENYML
ncbi:MAG: malic enzyme-like NAD(P)-binding protein [Succinivibrionaceae bacterium]|jgi:malate dehydrogenase (oxaloacetate-decarboxylating)(NADP+)|nr:malate dehydrogenase [Succinivibrionaceae bacterium]MCI6198871.1 malate dehydrogenase [Pseudomonadota bacterium]MDY3144597.1 malic enzyme-like NAD(P)-binding protein [Succinivibrionaceae bacterium]MDY6274603.1 malic enzyme-like NAD(P)-binding protein [Succinivibrionaceae bacterium]MDY6335452.1 malic enzyme-like NAD(P)-binding protein [Succinivibrionaceae bacterium]